MEVLMWSLRRQIRRCNFYGSVGSVVYRLNETARTAEMVNLKLEHDKAGLLLLSPR